jgi:hypothetical protein
MRNKGAGCHVHLAGIWLSVVLMAQGGCGIKSAPKPPERIIPARATDLKAAEEGTGVVLKWIVPEKNTDGSPLTDLEGFKIWKAETGRCPTCPPRFRRLAKIKYLYPEGAESATGAMEYLDKETGCGSFRYKVRGYNKKGHESSDNTATITIYVALASLTRLSAAGKDKRVELSWDKLDDAITDEGPIELAGYNVYRGQVSRKYSKLSVNKKPITTNRFVDLNVKNNQKYFYALRALYRIDDRLCEGNLSSEITALPEDLTPPNPPGGLFCEQVEEGLLLGWEENSETDLKGYHVYRKTEDALKFERLTPVPQKEAKFLDWQIRPYSWYIYKVTALDNAPRANESEPSIECTIQYRDEGRECPENGQCPKE